MRWLSLLLQLHMLHKITHSVVCDVLEVALRKALATLDNMDWEAHKILFGYCFGPGCSRRLPRGSSGLHPVDVQCMTVCSELATSV